MPRFSYSGINSTGASVAGEREAESAHDLVAALRAEGEFVHHLEDLDGPRGFQRDARPLRSEDLSLFTSQLAAMIQGGMPLAPALAELAREARGERLRSLLEDAQRQVEGGNTLEAALARHGGAIPPIYLSLIRIGERTGNLPGVLLHLTAFSQRRVQLTQRLQALLAYPIILFISLIIFLGVFVPLVISQFEVMFEQMGGSLPVPTRLLLHVGHFVQSLIPFMPLLILLYVGYVILLNTRARAGVRWIREALLLATPVAGRLYSGVLEARFYQGLGTLLESGAPIVESMCLAGLATGSPRVASASVRAAARTAQGESVSQVLSQFGIAKRSHAWMLNQAEAAGTLPLSLRRLADSCHRELEMEELSLCAAAGPVLIVIAGIVAGASIVSCFLPIFLLPQLVS